MLRSVLQPISDLSCNKSAGCFKTGLNEGGKTTSLFNSFHSNVAKQASCTFLWPVLQSLTDLIIGSLDYLRCKVCKTVDYQDW